MREQPVPLRLLALLTVGAVILVALMLWLAGCSSNDDQPRRIADEPTATATIPQPTPAPIPSATTEPPPPDEPPGIKVAVFVAFENHSRAQVKAGMPKFWAYAQKYGYVGDHKAYTHPSEPNYLVWAFGGTQGVKDDSSSHKINKPDVFYGAKQAGYSAKSYNEDMGSDRCRQSSSGDWAKKHAPWNFTVVKASRDYCEKNSLDYKYFATDVDRGILTNLSFVVPDLCHDAHDCSLGTADKFFDALVKKVQSGPQYKNGDVAIVGTWDEDNRKAGNDVLTVVINPTVQHFVAAGKMTHCSISGAMSDIGHSPRLGCAKTAPDFWDAFHLSVEQETP